VSRSRAGGFASPTSSPRGDPRGRGSPGGLRRRGRPLADHLRLVAAAGLEEVRIAEARPIPLPDAVLAAHLDAAGIAAFRASAVELRSVTLLARRPH